MSMNKRSKTTFDMILQATQVDRALRQRTLSIAKKQGDMTTTEWLLLSIISRGPATGVVLGALGVTLGVTKPQITALIDNLTLKRLIKIQRSKQDGRSKAAIITERGKDALKRVDKALDESFSDLLKTIPGTHLQIYNQVQDEISRRSA